MIITKGFFGKVKNMIDNYVIEWASDPIILTNENVFFKDVFEKMTNFLWGTFKFNFNTIQRHDENTSFLKFSKETDWIFAPEKTSFNCFYAHNVEDLNLVLIYKDKSQAIRIKPSHFYCFPYWMTYKFMSDIKDKNQELIKICFWSDTRPINKMTNIIW